MEDDRAVEPVARDDEVPEEVAGAAAVGVVVGVGVGVGNAEEALAAGNKGASAAGSNIAAVDTLAVRNVGTEAAVMDDRTGQKRAAGSAAALEDLAAAALAGPDAFEEVEGSAPGRTRRPPR